MKTHVRRAGAMVVGVMLVAAVGCQEPPTGGGAPPVTLVPPPACDAAPPQAVAGAPAIGVAEVPLDATTAAEAAAVAVDEARSASGTGTVVIVAVDDSGRPQFITAAADGAVEIAVDLAADPGGSVVAVDAVTEVSVAGSSAVSTGAGAPIADDPRRPEQWGMTDLQIEDAWELSTGESVKIAIVDSGVRASHPDFDGRICGGASFLNNAAAPTLGGGAVDGNGHGTHVAGIAAAGAHDGIGVVGVAPDADLIPVRVLSSSGRGYSTDVASGVVWAVDHGADIVNLSLGGPESADMIAAVDYAVTHGVLVVAAAGNDGPLSPPSWPAAIPEVLTVASYEPDRSVSSFSSHGDYVDVAAPGGDILSTGSDGQWNRKSGTSMASPHIAGIAALALELDAALTPAALAGLVESTAVDAGAPGFDVAFGHGIVSPLDVLQP